MADQASNFDAARSFAEFGLKEKAEGRRESASGPGSARAAAEPALQLLRRTISERDIASILDLGCGDWNWMRDLGLPGARAIRYEGWDASDTLIADMQATYGQPGLIDFAVKDLTTAPLPPVDLIILRDVLFHMPAALALRVLGRVRAASRYMLSTSFLDMTENADIAAYLPIDGWGFHRINLNVAPFDLADAMIEAVPEPLCTNKGVARFACLYRFDTRATPG